MTGCDNCERRERGTCTRERDTGRRDIVTCIEPVEKDGMIMRLFTELVGLEWDS